MAVAVTKIRQSDIWWIHLLQGAAGILLGLMIITSPGATLLFLVTILGFYWLFTGTLALVRVFVDRSISWVWSLLIGIIGVFAGLVVLRHPLLAALTVPAVIVIVLGAQGLFMGIFEILGAFSGGGLASFLLGVVNLEIGVLLLESSLMATLMTPLTFGVLLLIQGLALVVVAFRARPA